MYPFNALYTIHQAWRTLRFEDHRGIKRQDLVFLTIRSPDQIIDPGDGSRSNFPFGCGHFLLFFRPTLAVGSQLVGNLFNFTANNYKGQTR